MLRLRSPRRERRTVRHNHIDRIKDVEVNKSVEYNDHIWRRTDEAVRVRTQLVEDDAQKKRLAIVETTAQIERDHLQMRANVVAATRALADAEVKKRDDVVDAQKRTTAELVRTDLEERAEIAVATRAAQRELAVIKMQLAEANYDRTVVNKELEEGQVKVHRLHAQIAAAEERAGVMGPSDGGPVLTPFDVPESIIPVTTLNAKFNQFIVERCELGSYQVIGVDIQSAFRLWHGEPARATFEAFGEYLGERFTPRKLVVPDEDGTTNGYKGIRLKPRAPVALSTTNVFEAFLTEMCSVKPRNKVLSSYLTNEYAAWLKSTGKGAKGYGDAYHEISRCFGDAKWKEHVLVSNVHAHNGSGDGFYGVCMLKDVGKMKAASTSRKPVERYDAITDEVIDEWGTIADAMRGLGMNHGQVTGCIAGGSVLHGKYKLRFAEKPPKAPPRAPSAKKCARVPKAGRQ